MQAIRDILAQETVEASAPCRIDMGGTLDLSTFYRPLRHLEPCTFNLALDMRTRVRLAPGPAGKLKISSRGFEGVEVDARHAPFDHPLGLMMAVALFFKADGVHIDIQSASPPRSALGGSSVAAVALVWAFYKARAKIGEPLPQRGEVARLAQSIEQTVAGVPCGLQDQLAAVYGGGNAWYWRADHSYRPYKRVAVVAPQEVARMAARIMVAYCGAPHMSRDVNSTWVRQFEAGEKHDAWHKIVVSARKFVTALAQGDISVAQEMMNQETELRCDLTPEVLDETGAALVRAARKFHCGARFTGAGGGGCIWALGQPEQLDSLRPAWEKIVARQATAQILPVGIDTVGLL